MKCIIIWYLLYHVTFCIPMLYCSREILYDNSVILFWKLEKNASTRISSDEEEKKREHRRTSLVIRGKLFGRSISRRCLCETRASRVGPRSPRWWQRFRRRLHGTHVFFPRQIMRPRVSGLQSRWNEIETISVGQRRQKNI